MSSPVVELKAGPPVRRPKQSLQGTGKINKHVAHQEEPKEGRTERGRKIHRKEKRQT